MQLSQPQQIFSAVGTCNAFSPMTARRVEDGIAGARDDLGPAPSIDIANGAPNSDISAAVTPLGWTENHRGALGDPRASSQNDLGAEYLGDYMDAVATRAYGAAVYGVSANSA